MLAPNSGENSQLTSNILMIRPSNFGFNIETADNNSFQINDNSLSKDEIIKKAIEEFDAFVKVLRSAGIHVHVHQEKEGAESTDSVFPNNWFSSHQDGLLITYPMFSPKRRTERYPAVISELEESFHIKKHVPLEKWEENDRFLEGTGSMIFDRPNKIVYACRSVRTDEEVLDEFCRLNGYTKVLFDPVDRAGDPIYHTNVMMAVGNTFVVICMDSIKSEEQRNNLISHFGKTDKEVIDISLDQMEEFAGNMLQVKNSRNEHFLVMSSRAFKSLSPDQIAQIERHTQILHSDLKVIETYGGGSARCMMAEVFLPPKN